jgi:IS30 family transposase
MAISIWVWTSGATFIGRAATGRLVQQIADALCRHPSTIYRELKRNRHLDENPLFRGYLPTVAQTMARVDVDVRGGKVCSPTETGRLYR